MRRYSGKWMSLADDRVLEYVYEEESGTPQEMVDAGLRFTRQHLSRRCKKLTEYGLLRHLGNGVYVITEEGGQYLEGELDTGELESGDEE